MIVTKQVSGMVDDSDDGYGNGNNEFKAYSTSLLKQAFKEYYFNHTALVEAPDAIHEREFGYSRFDGTMIRHLSIRDRNELIALLLMNVPADVYCSAAYYTSPDRPMDEKGFNGADLIFDIDVKELKPRCSNMHDIHLCAECSEPIHDQSICTRCGSKKINHVTMPCDECISLGKGEVKKLLEILMEDFDVAEDSMRVYFSGNYGFHVYVKGRYTMLDSAARLEVANYIMGKGLMDALMKEYRRRDGGKSGKNKGRDRSRSSSGSSSKKMDSRDIVKGYDIMDIQLPASILAGEHGWIGRIRRYLSSSNKISMKSVEDAILALSARIDPSVTMDTHRIFRLPGTLNSKSSLAKVPLLNLADIDSFDPFISSCLISDREVNVHVIEAPRFTLKGNTFGPYMQEEVTLPLYAACYLICKGIAYAKHPSS